MSTINLDVLLAPVGARAVKPCVIGRVLLALPEQPYRAAFQALIDDETVSTLSISERLNAAGLPGSHASLHRHRRGLCTCEKAGGAA